MPDAWTLDTPGGPYALNPSFSAPQYEPGGIAGPGALRRDDRTQYQRSGDGLRTPGALTLVGRVWRDDHNHNLMMSELNAIRAAVTACTSVTRVNNAGTYTYDHLAGGATPEITPDGLGGWMVRLDLWPGRAEPTFVPAGGGGGDVDVLTAGAVVSDGTVTINASIVAGDYVALILHRNTQSAAPSSLPGWLALLGHTSGTSFGGDPHSASIYGGHAPTSITEIVIPDLPNNSFAVLAAIGGVTGAVVQHSAATPGFPSPLPGFSTPGGCLLVLLEARRYSSVFGAGQPGTQVTVRNVLGASDVSGRITVRRVEADTTGNLPLTNGVSGSWRGGMAIAVPLHGV